MWFPYIFTVCGKYYVCIVSNGAESICVLLVLKHECFQMLELLYAVKFLDIKFCKA